MTQVLGGISKMWVSNSYKGNGKRKFDGENISRTAVVGVGGCFSPTMARGASYLSNNVAGISINDDNEEFGDDNQDGEDDDGTREVSGDNENIDSDYVGIDVNASSAAQSVSPPKTMRKQVKGGTSSKRKSEAFYFYNMQDCKYHNEVLKALVNLSFDIIRPHRDLSEVPPEVANGTRYWPFFKDAIGALDGTLIDAIVSDTNGVPFRDRHGKKSWNVLAYCSFDRIYTFINVGWEGSVHDTTVWKDSLGNPKFNFPHPPPGKLQQSSMADDDYNDMDMGTILNILERVLQVEKFFSNLIEKEVWDGAECKKVRTLSGHQTRVGVLAWSSRILASERRDRNILQHDLRVSNDYVSKLVGHKSETVSYMAERIVGQGYFGVVSQRRGYGYGGLMEWIEGSKQVHHVKQL
uniref:DDE Tnp4 domain-containing protein n=1 Tax=Chenopodium quinoa TaxID=63459 RepID=A0A803N0V2_CHEQI